MRADRMSSFSDDRTRRLLGDAAMEALSRSRVLIAGIGGVGGYALEILARSGVGFITAIDSDRVEPTNLNRQLLALHSTLGMPKTAVAEARCRDINPDIAFETLDLYIDPENVGEILESTRPDFVIDAIDTIAPKCALISGAVARGIPIISSMGAGARLHPEKVCCTRLSKTANDGLAKAVRQRLRREHPGIDIPVVWSSEEPVRHEIKAIEGAAHKLSSPGSFASVTAAFGILLANYALLHLIKPKG